MERLSRLPIVAQPGARFVYGYNTDILGCVVEKVSGQSLADFFAARILARWACGTPGSTPRPRRHAWPPCMPPATAGWCAPRRGPRGQGSYLEGPRTSYSGGAGLVSSAGDYARFLQMLANGGSLDGAQILGPRTVGLMIADHADTLFSRNGLGFGLGFELLEEPGRAGRYGPSRPVRLGRRVRHQLLGGPEGWPGGGVHGPLLPAGPLDLADRLRTLVYQAVARER